MEVHSPDHWIPKEFPEACVLFFFLVYANFIYDSVFLGCTFQGIYPFSLIYPICWHVIVLDSFHICGISGNIFFVYLFKSSFLFSLLNFLLIFLLKHS